MDKLTIVSYNVHGLNHPIKRKKIFYQLKKMQCSIALLQETHLSEKEHIKLKREWVNLVYSASNGKKRGVAILISKTLAFSAEKVVQDKSGRYVMVVGSVGGTEISILNVYAPNEYDPGFFKEIANIIAENSKGMLVIGGDFNAVQDGKKDRNPIEKGPQSPKTHTLNNFISELGLVDPWRTKNPKGKDFSFFSNVHNSYSRIDFFCLPQQYMYKVIECQIEPITLSDHAPIILKIDLGMYSFFRYWRLNVSLLNNTETVEDLRQQLKEYFEINDNGEVNPSILWEGAKAVIRGKIIQISSQLKRRRLEEQLSLENKIKLLEIQHKNNRSSNTATELKEARKSLDKLLSHKAEGALRFSRQRYYEMGNRASRLLAFQLRKAQANRTVSKVVHPTVARIVSHPKEVADAFASFYQNLYKEPKLQTTTDNTNTFLANLNLPELSEEVSLSMVTPISEIEIRDAIKRLKNNSSPGEDGFSGEFYKCFINDLVPILTRVFRYALSKNDPPETWSRAIISVIHKEGKDPTLCEGYRPISLICNDQKLLTSILARRIQKHITTLINPDQTGFIPSRQGANNIRRTLNIITCSKKNKQTSMLISFDAQKAFDTVNWDFLYKTLSVMGFHPEFINWVRAIYKNPKSRVRVNGCCSEFFELQRGVRQGDCLSPLLFAINIEPLAAAIRQNKEIKGIKDMGNREHKISLYADDILTYISDPVISVPALMDTLKEYGELSGYQINQSKSEAMMLVGQWPIQLTGRLNVHWSQGFRYLGIIITTDLSKLFKINYGKLMGHIKADLTRWEILPLSLIGRIETIRMNVLPRLLFLFQSLPIYVPAATFTALNKWLSKFIWQSKPPRLKLRRLLCPKDNGGLNLPDLKKYYWAAQLRAMVAWLSQETDTIWVGMEQSECPDTPLDSFPFLNLDHCGKKKITNIWVKNTLKIWSVVRKKLKLPMTISRAIRIASNSEFLPARLDRCFERWRERGIVVLDQLFEGSVLKSFEQLKEKYELPTQDFYRYLQIRHYLHTHQEWEKLCSPPSKIEKFFISTIETTVKARFISHLYRILQEELKENNLDIKEKWELEMNIIISDEQWENSCEQGHRVTSSPNWREFGWKIKMRYFRTPLITSKWSNTSAQCWRGCGKVGDHTHIFWDCPKLSEYWKKIQREIKTCLFIDIPLEPSHFILGILPDNLEENSQTKLLRALLLIANKVITSCWLKPQPPTITQWRDRIQDMYRMEHLTALLQLKIEAFINNWSPIAIHFHLI